MQPGVGLPVGGLPTPGPVAAETSFSSAVVAAQGWETVQRHGRDVTVQRDEDMGRINLSREPGGVWGCGFAQARLGVLDGPHMPFLCMYGMSTQTGDGGNVSRASIVGTNGCPKARCLEVPSLQHLKVRIGLSCMCHGCSLHLAWRRVCQTAAANGTDARRKARAPPVCTLDVTGEAQSWLASHCLEMATRMLVCFV